MISNISFSPIHIKTLYIFVLSILIVSCSETRNKMQTDSRIIEEQTGAFVCPQSETTLMPSLVLSEFAISNDIKKCAKWRDEPNNAYMYTANFKVFDRLLPAIITIMPDIKNTKNNGPILIRIVGGPGGSIAPSPRDLAANRILKSARMVITLGYTGSNRGSMYPNPDFDIAASEVSYITNQLHRLNKNSSIVLYGESLGGMIAAAAISKQFNGFANHLILVAPLIFSPNEAISNFDRLYHNNYAQDAILTIFLLKPEGKGIWSQVHSMDLLINFFPKSRMDSDLNTYMTGRDQVPTTIIYGTLDDRIGIQKISLISKRQNLNTIPFTGVDHNITIDQYSVIMTIVERIANKLN